jgi:myosin tail region-interacting protein MTI1
MDTPIRVLYKGVDEKPCDLHLELSSLWFAQKLMAWPPPWLKALEGEVWQISSSSYEISGQTVTWTVIIAIQWVKTLATTKIRMSWSTSDPSGTIRAEQRHAAPPRALTPRQLAAAQELYGERIARWCESRKGTQVGNGVCWTLAHDALQAVAEECKARGEEPPLIPHTGVHGVCIYAHYPPNSPPSPPGGVTACGVARGDIVQLLSARYIHAEGWAYEMGAPMHTAVVVGVEKGGEVIKVMEQNINFVKRVVEGNYQLKELVGGEMQLYRPVGESWAKLEATWE